MYGSVKLICCEEDLEKVVVSLLFSCQYPGSFSSVSPVETLDFAAASKVA